MYNPWDPNRLYAPFVTNENRFRISTRYRARPAGCISVHYKDRYTRDDFESDEAYNAYNTQRLRERPKPWDADYFDNPRAYIDPNGPELTPEEERFLEGRGIDRYLGRPLFPGRWSGRRTFHDTLDDSPAATQTAPSLNLVSRYYAGNEVSRAALERALKRDLGKVRLNRVQSVSVMCGVLWVLGCATGLLLGRFFG